MDQGNLLSGLLFDRRDRLARPAKHGKARDSEAWTKGRSMAAASGNRRTFRVVKCMPKLSSGKDSNSLVPRLEIEED